MNRPSESVKKSPRLPPENLSSPLMNTFTSPRFTENATCDQSFAGISSPVTPSNHGSLPLHSIVLPSQPCGTMLIHAVENGSPPSGCCSSTAPKNAVVNIVSAAGFAQNDTEYS